jgi:hypothetical protein
VVQLERPNVDHVTRLSGYGAIAQLAGGSLKQDPDLKSFALDNRASKTHFVSLLPLPAKDQRGLEEL